MTDLARSCYHTMLVTVINPADNHAVTHVVPLNNIHLDFRDENIAKVLIERIELDIPKGFTVSISVSDDPYMENASDWSHLGCFRVRIGMVDAWSENGIIMCDKKNLQKGVITPGRLYHDYTKANLLL
mgnify:CR=1 FL=1